MADYLLESCKLSHCAKAVRWSAVVTTKRGNRIAVEGIGVFSFDDQRKLRSVREFYDVGTLQQIFSS